MKGPDPAMRILIVSNLYPPHYLGGYELGCHDVVAGLSAKGHDVRVLTSTFGIDAPESDGQVYRWLELDLNWRPEPLRKHAIRLLRKEVQNQKAFRLLIKTLRPDFVYIWNLTHVSVSIAQIAEQSGLPVCYFVSDKWLSRWQTDPWHQLWSGTLTRAAVRAGTRAVGLWLRLRGIIYSGSLLLPNTHFVSDFLKQDALAAGQPVATGEVIHWGVDLEKFCYRPESNRPRRLLYVGQIAAMKGVRTIIEAMRIVVKESGAPQAKLTIVGGTITPDFAAEMRTLVESYGLSDNVEFAGFVPREDLPEIYRQFDVLLFPSLFDEALTITTLEAMACGLAVVATATGGNVEVMKHEQNALIFGREDAQTCAAHVLRLLNTDELFESLRRNGRQTVEQGFSIERMVERIERSLLSKLGRRDASPTVRDSGE
jgi:glycogen(starch) synthase